MRALIKNIKIGPCRGGLDQKKITRYRQALRRGETFPPIDAIKNGPGLYKVMDGWHRYHAYKREGRKTIPINVKVE